VYYFNLFLVSTVSLQCIYRGANGYFDINKLVGLIKMLESILYDEITYWLLGTAIVFTMLGRQLAVKDSVTNIVQNTIDSLIAQGYIKTKGEGDNVEILKHWE
jgi:hypothetical protein